MMSNRLREITRQGQSIWLDALRRDFIEEGSLKRWIEEDDLRGVTSNPAIFEKAIAGNRTYRAEIKRLLCEDCRDPKSIFEALAIRDIRDAADLMRPVYDRTDGLDGYVSLEVSPQLANDTEGTLEEARRLWRMIDRPNAMIKVPGTEAGVPAVETLIGEGMNVNVTLLFSRQAYDQVAEAYLRGLERRLEDGKPVSRVASVASFFISRIDSAVDKRLDGRATVGDGVDPSALRGQVAIANAKLTYRRYGQIYSSDRWQKMVDEGAKPQRLLWASTSTKNPSFSDVYYVDALIGPGTVNTVPEPTFEAARKNATVSPALCRDVAEAEQVLADLEQAGLPLDEITAECLEQGVGLFEQAFDRLLETIGEVRTDCARELV
jgi:transaldolase / glucose-6-phosphate isomerase